MSIHNSPPQGSIRLALVPSFCICAALALGHYCQGRGRNYRWEQVQAAKDSLANGRLKDAKLQFDRVLTWATLAKGDDHYLSAIEGLIQIAEMTNQDFSRPYAELDSIIKSGILDQQPEYWLCTGLLDHSMGHEVGMIRHLYERCGGLAYPYPRPMSIQSDGWWQPNLRDPRCRQAEEFNRKLGYPPFASHCGRFTIQDHFEALWSLVDAGQVAATDGNQELPKHAVEVEITGRSDVWLGAFARGAWAHHRPDGFWIIYYADGSEFGSGNVANGKREGPWLIRDKGDPTVRHEVSFTSGRRHGKYRQWGRLGHIASEGQYDQGFRVGLWTSYQSDGIEYNAVLYE